MWIAKIAGGRARLAWVAVAVGLATAVAFGPTPGAGDGDVPMVTMMRAWEHSAYTRLVFELTDAVAFDIFALESPRRLVIDLPTVTFALAGTPFDAGAVGVVDRMRYGSFRSDVSRIVLDLNAPIRVERAFLIPPEDGNATRFVLDLAVSDPAEFVTFVHANRKKPAPPSPAPRAPLPGDGAVIVIDPGHGGIDPGAVGATGVLEKNVALEAARELAERLAARRYRVVLTRDGDLFVGLRDRVAIARDAGADLFLSIHADSMENSRIRGSHVYSLSQTASDAEAEALAAKENKSDIIAGLDLADYSADVNTILLDLSQRETNNLSAALAGMIVESFSRRGIRSIGRPHRQAGFAVLKAPDVPSVLIELGFLSNREDERTLLVREGREPIVDAVVEAVERYFSALAVASD